MAVREGQSVGPYRLLELAGSGGAGDVWRARDDRLARDVAIKVLHGPVADSDARRRLVAEARALSALNHPHIVVVHDVLSLEDSDLLVMEFVPGDVLSRRIPAAGLSLREGLKLAIGIADALAAAHAAGVIHRDIKPANVLISRSGMPKILDFGLARRQLSAAAEITIGQTAESLSGFISGTPAYMSPEQAEGRVVDHRTDIFSFGVLLYELLTGRRVFERASIPETLTAVMRDEVQMPAGWPASLARAVQRCLRKDPERRFQSMADVRLELEDVLEDIQRSSDSPVAATSAPRRDQWWRGVALASTFLAMLIAAGALLLSRAGRDEPLWRMRPLSTLPGLEQQPVLSPSGDHVAFMWDGGDPGNHDIYVQQVDGLTPPLRLTTNPLAESSPAWSPDGRHIAFLRLGESATDVMMVSALGGAERRAAQIARRTFAIDVIPPTRIDWSPDGRFIAVGTAPLSLLDLETGAVLPLQAAPSPGGDRDPVFSPDGRTIVYSRGTAPVFQQLWSQQIDGQGRSAGQPRLLAPEYRAYVGATWLDDASVLAAAGWPGSTTTLFRVALTGGWRRLPVESVAAWHPHYSPAHRRLVYQRRIVATDVFRLTLGPTPALDARPLIASTYQDREAKYSPDGTRIVFISTRSGQPAVWRANRDGTNQVLIGNVEQGLPGSPRWMPDGGHVVFDSVTAGTSSVVFVVSAEGGAPRRLTSRSAPEVRPFPSQDGRYVYLTIEGGLWKVPFEGGDPVLVVPNATQGRESRDGRTIYFLRDGGMWRVPAAGGQEERFTSGIAGNTWTLGAHDLYVIKRAPDGRSHIAAYDLSTGAERLVMELPPGTRFFSSDFLDIAPDETSALISVISRDESDLVIVDDIP